MNINPKRMLNAAVAAYNLDNAEAVSGYYIDKIFPGEGNGFKAVAFKSIVNDDCIIAFAGTENAQDAYQDVKLGWNQWEQNRDAVLNYVSGALKDDSAAKIHFTGHSLGGALAQYAAYDVLYAAKNGSPKNGYGTLSHIKGLVDQLSLTTFNGLGGIGSLEDYSGTINETYDPTLADGLQNTHYFVQGDMVSRLGEGHLGGHTVMLSDPEGSYDPLTGHVLNTVTDLFNSDTTQYTPAVPGYLQVAGIRQRASAFIGLSNTDDAVGPQEAKSGLIKLLNGLLFHPKGAADLEGAGRGELNALMGAVFTDLGQSATLNELAPGLSRQECRQLAGFDWERFLEAGAWEGKLLDVTGQPYLAKAAVIEHFFAGSFEVENPGGIIDSLPDDLFPGSDKAKIKAAVDILDTFGFKWSLPGKAIFDALSHPDSGHVLVASGPTVQEGESGQLTITLDNPAPASGTPLALRVELPSVATLSGDAVTLIDADKGLYKIDIASGKKTVSVNVKGATDADQSIEWTPFEVGSVPFSKLGTAFDDKVYAVGSIEVTEDVPARVHPDPVIYGAGKDPDATVLNGTGGGEVIDATDRQWKVLAGGGDDNLYANTVVDPQKVADSDSVGGADEKGWLSGRQGDDLVPDTSSSTISPYRPASVAQAA